MLLYANVVFLGCRSRSVDGKTVINVNVADPVDGSAYTCKYIGDSNMLQGLQQLKIYRGTFDFMTYQNNGYLRLLQLETSPK